MIHVVAASGFYGSRFFHEYHVVRVVVATARRRHGAVTGSEFDVD